MHDFSRVCKQANTDELGECHTLMHAGLRRHNDVCIWNWTCETWKSLDSIWQRILKMVGFEFIKFVQICFEFIKCSILSMTICMFNYQSALELEHYHIHTTRIHFRNSRTTHHIASHYVTLQRYNFNEFFLDRL